MIEDKTMSEIEYTMNQSMTAPTNVFRHKPVFDVERFDQSNIEHIRGNMTVRVNRTMAIEIIKLIDSVELESSEAFLHAFKCHLSNWLNIRKEVLNRLASDGMQESEQSYHNNSVDDSCR